MAEPSVLNIDAVCEESITALARQIMHGGFDLDHIPQFVRRILGENQWQKEMWRKRYSPIVLETIEFRSFEEFVTTPVPRGLGCSIDRLKRLCSDDRVALDAIDKVMVRGPGRPKAEMLDNIQGYPSGTSRDRALRMLRDKRPDLHARVLADEISPHAAMISAGFRQKTITVPFDPHRAMTILIRHFGADVIRAVLNEEEEA